MRSVILPFLIAIAGMGIAFGWREWQMLRARRRNHARFSPRGHGEALRIRADEIARVLSRDTLASPELASVPALTDDATADARAAVDLAAGRFGLDSSQLLVVAGGSPSIPGAVGVARLPVADYTVALDSDTIHFAVDEVARPSRASIHIAPAARASAELHQLIAAHEVAHQVLYASRLFGPDRRTEEESVDIALILGGFGELLSRLSYRQYRELDPGSTPVWKEEEWSNLSSGAITFLRAYRAQLAGIAQA